MCAERFFDVAAHGFGGIKLRLLRQIANLDAGLRTRFAFDVGIETGHDFQQRGFAGAVQTQHADLCAGVKR